jgi:hypothetical protein
MAIQISDVSNALQKVIMPYIRDNLPKETILLDKVKRNAGVTFMNDNFYAPIRTSRHGGVHNLANDGNKLNTGKTSLGQASVGVKILTGTFDISKLAIDATKTTKGAVENQLTFQAQSLSSDFARSVNRQMFQDGSGVISEVSGSANATVVAVRVPTASNDDGRAQDRYGAVNGDISAVKYIPAGAIIGLGTAGAAVGTVASVANGGSVGTITLTGGAAHAANDAIYLLDADGEGAGTAEITGLGAALSSGAGDYAGVARSIVGWDPQTDVTSEALTLSAMETQYLRAKEYSMSGDQYAIFVNLTLYKKYGDLLTAMRRTVDTADLLGGWTGLEFAAGGGRVGVFLDYDVPDGEALIVNLDSLTVTQVSDMDWLENPGEGSMLRRSDYITYQATMVWFMNMLCLAPGANAKLARKTG